MLLVGPPALRSIRADRQRGARRNLEAFDADDLRKRRALEQRKAGERVLLLDPNQGPELFDEVGCNEDAAFAAGRPF